MSFSRRYRQYCGINKQWQLEDVIFHSRIVLNCLLRLRKFTLSKRIFCRCGYELATSNSNIKDI